MGTIVNLRCVAHVLDLIIKKYMRNHKIIECLTKIIHNNHLKSVFILTRWLSCEKEMKNLVNRELLPKTLEPDYKIISIFASAVKMIEGNHVSYNTFYEVLIQLKKNL